MQLLQEEEETFPGYIQTSALLSSLKIAITTAAVSHSLGRNSREQISNCSRIQTTLCFPSGEGSGHGSVCPLLAAEAWMFPEITPGRTRVINPFCSPTCSVHHLLFAPIKSPSCSRPAQHKAVTERIKGQECDSPEPVTCTQGGFRSCQTGFQLLTPSKVLKTPLGGIAVG